MPGDPSKPASLDGSYRSIPPDDPSVTPRDLKVKIADQKLLVDWADGKKSELDLAVLRRHCPCATCRSDRDSQLNNPFKILKSDPARLRVIDARLVGNYAISFTWSDGHNTGIFEFRFLRALEVR